jgi:hypothetical protein
VYKELQSVLVLLGQDSASPPIENKDINSNIDRDSNQQPTDSKATGEQVANAKVGTWI